ncbi:MAG: class I SAM-dependent methyltransferase [Candidatus Bathyarchaeia archaeon]|jgi:2-polyprenyl-3-methyl-5-hydroxy-6-metoxy-1,4-benzoquinol methylase
MLKAFSRQIQGIKYLLTHPHQLKWVVTREIYFGQRKNSKKKWVEWQKYDAKMHIMMMQAHAETLSVNTLNATRIQIFIDMVNTIGKDLKILDVGCGDGVISEPIMKMGNYVAALELPTVATLAKKCKVSTVMAGDAEELAFASESFDLVIASEVVEHLWEPKSFLNEAHRVLKPSGYMIIETPEGEKGLNYDSHRNFFTVDRLKEMLNTRFTLNEVKRLEATGSAQTPTIILLLRKIIA